MKRFLAVFGILILVFTRQILAADILQDQGENVKQIQLSEPIAQTFTAEDSSMLSIGFGLEIMNSGYSDLSLSAQLYEGAGIGGSLLASATASPPASLDYFRDFFDFPFPSVNLNPGASYTVLLQAPNSAWGVAWNQWAYAAPPYANIPGRVDYPNGDAIWDGQIKPYGDLRFRVTRAPAATHILSVGVNWDSGKHGEGPAARGGDNAENVLNAFGTSANLGSAVLLTLDEHDTNAKQVFFNSLESVLQGVRPGDTFVLYLSTHGGTWNSGDENDELSISAADEMVALSATEFLEDDELYAWLADNGPEGWDEVNKLFILGPCHSGGFWGGDDAGDLDRLTKAALLSAAAEDTNSYYDGATGLSFFADEIVRALTTDRSTADTNGDGVVTIQELADYTIAGVGTAQYVGLDFPIHGFEPEPGTVLPFEYSPVFLHTGDWQDIPLSVPEPSSIVLLAMGALGLLVVARRRRK